MKAINIVQIILTSIFGFSMIVTGLAIERGDYKLTALALSEAVVCFTAYLITEIAISRTSKPIKK